MVNLSFGGLHSKEKQMAPFGFLLASKASLKPPLFAIKHFLGNLGLPFHTSAFGPYSLYDPLPNVTLAFEYFSVLFFFIPHSLCCSSFLVGSYNEYLVIVSQVV